MADRAVAVANAFLSLPRAQETLTQMQLQKLDFIANGWNLALNGERLIMDTPEAWTYGPVYRDLYDHTKFFGKRPIGRLITPDDDEAAIFFSRGGRPTRPPYVANLEEHERAIIRHVWNRYGGLSGIRLSELTHQRGTPWFETITTAGRDAPIREDLIAAHYNDLAARASETAPA